MGSVSLSAHTFANSLEKAIQELEEIGVNLQAEFSHRFAHAEVNPYDLFLRLKSLQRDIPMMQEECQQLVLAKQDLVDKANKALLSNRDSLSQLEKKAGIKKDAEDDQAVFQAYSDAIAQWNQKLLKSDRGKSDEEEEIHEALNKALAASVL